MGRTRDEEEMAVREKKKWEPGNFPSMIPESNLVLRRNKPHVVLSLKLKKYSHVIIIIIIIITSGFCLIYLFTLSMRSYI